MSNLLWKKSEGSNKTKTKSATVAVCQECGNTWYPNGKRTIR